MAKISARTGIHCRNQHELRWKSHAARCAGHRDLPVFERLAHYLQRRSLELRQLIEKKHAVVREAYFAGIWKRAAAKKTDIADGVMGWTKWSYGNKRFIRVEQASNAMNLCCLNCFVEGERRDDGRNAFGQHRFPEPGGPIIKTL